VRRSISIEEKSNMIAADDITVELRLATPNAKVKAFADVTITLGQMGTMVILGFSLIGDLPRVVPPAREKEKRYFDVVLLSGKLKTLVYTLIGIEYKKALEMAAKETA
jgi:hypothetical protein